MASLQRSEFHEDETRIYDIDEGNLTSGWKKYTALELGLKTATLMGWERAFREAITWLRKGDEAESPTDKLISYWIAMETLCTKSELVHESWFLTSQNDSENTFSIIREVVGKMCAVTNFYDLGWRVYRRVSHLRADSRIPLELLLKSQLKVVNGEAIRLINFLDCSEELESIVKSELIKERLREMRKFYSDDADFAKDTLKAGLEGFQDELLLLYRMRNKIAHDGSSDHPSLVALSQAAGRMAHMLMSRVVADCGTYGRPLAQVLIAQAQRYDLLLLRLKNETPRAILIGGS